MKEYPMKLVSLFVWSLALSLTRSPNAPPPDSFLLDRLQ